MLSSAFITAASPESIANRNRPVMTITVITMPVYYLLLARPYYLFDLALEVTEVFLDPAFFLFLFGSLGSL